MLLCLYFDENLIQNALVIMNDYDCNDAIDFMYAKDFKNHTLLEGLAYILLYMRTEVQILLY